MLGSHSPFFHKNKAFLANARLDLIKALELKNRSKSDIKKYLEAYDFFCKNPSRFDGATIVKDLIDLNYGNGIYLDSDAMLHDYDYIGGDNVSFIKKWKSDLRYIKNMEMNGKGIRVLRFILLSIAGIGFVPYVNIKYWLNPQLKVKL